MSMPVFIVKSENNDHPLYVTILAAFLTEKDAKTFISTLEKTGNNKKYYSYWIDDDIELYGPGEMPDYDWII